MNPFEANAPLTVSQLNHQVKFLLESQYPSVPVTGEISNLSRPASGHLYFTLKDQGAQIRCALFKSTLARSRYRPQQGDKVLLRGKLSLYEGRGDYQIIVSGIQPEGEGALQAAYFQLKARLEQEGLFDPAHKRPLPNVIRRVGVVTSQSGAAFHDIRTVLQRRFPAIEIILYPTAVQGKEATAQIVQAIETANRLKQVDVLIVGRGGGSLEDLWCFNEEAVARAIYQSELPIVSAVGHEVDVAISDFVADVRAATPSQAAELVSPDQADYRARLAQLLNRQSQAMRGLLASQQQTLRHLSQRLRNPAERVREWQQRLDERESRLHRALAARQQRQKDRLLQLSERLRRASPVHRLHQDQHALAQLKHRLNRAQAACLSTQRSRLATIAGQLNALSPLNTLQRGYSITRTGDKQVIQSAEQVAVGEQIITLVRQGRITSQVVSTSPTLTDD
ncbi:MAG: exodeoxyribonuclease VII large subunit [Saccharospirillum sp.]